MRNKRKGILMACAILGSAAIVSTGFAAWVVTINETETAQGSIQVDEVQDKTHLIEVKNEDLDVYFGKTTKTATYSWLVNNADKDQDLTASFTVEVTNYTTANLDVSISTPEAFKAERNGKRLLKDPVINLSKETLDPVGDTTTGTVNVTITFDWGEYFNGQNPINFYNAIEKPAETIFHGTYSYAQDAVETLKIIEKLKSLEYTVTLETTDGSGTVTKS